MAKAKKKAKAKKAPKKAAPKKKAAKKPAAKKPAKKPAAKKPAAKKAPAKKAPKAATGSSKEAVISAFRDFYAAGDWSEEKILATDPNGFDADPGPFYEQLGDDLGVATDPDNDYFGGFGGTVAKTIAFIDKQRGYIPAVEDVVEQAGPADDAGEEVGDGAGGDDTGEDDEDEDDEDEDGDDDIVAVDEVTPAAASDAVEDEVDTDDVSDDGSADVVAADDDDAGGVDVGGDDAADEGDDGDAPADDDEE